MNLVLYEAEEVSIKKKLESNWERRPYLKQYRIFSILLWIIFKTVLWIAIPLFLFEQV
ncbi:unnamed protein product [Prunus brigantina]